MYRRSTGTILTDLDLSDVSRCGFEDAGIAARFLELIPGSFGVSRELACYMYRYRYY